MPTTPAAGSEKLFGLAFVWRALVSLILISSLIEGFMGPSWGPPGADRTQLRPMLALWTLISGIYFNASSTQPTKRVIYVWVYAGQLFSRQRLLIWLWIIILTCIISGCINHQQKWLFNQHHRQIPHAKFVAMILCPLTTYPCDEDVRYFCLCISLLSLVVKQHVCW